jgi:hypothetical protein
MLEAAETVAAFIAGRDRAAFDQDRMLVVGTRIPVDAVLDNAEDGYGPISLFPSVSFTAKHWACPAFASACGSQGKRSGGTQACPVSVPSRFGSLPGVSLAHANVPKRGVGCASQRFDNAGCHAETPG